MSSCSRWYKLAIDREEQPSRLAAYPSAGFLRRTIATCLDMLVFTALSVALLLPVSSAIEWSMTAEHFDQLARDLSDPGWTGHAAGMFGLWLALWWAYFVVGWGLAGATPGKWICGLRVVDHKGGCPIGVSRALMRLVAYSASSCTLCWGHLLVLIRSDRRALHDILAGTRVLRCSCLKRLRAQGAPEEPT